MTKKIAFILWANMLGYDRATKRLPSVQEAFQRHWDKAASL